MSLYDDLMNAQIGLSAEDFGDNGTVVLRNDADEKGDYIEKWDYSEPIPDGLKLGK